MPRISDEKRQQWESHQKHQAEFNARIEEKYGAKQKRHAECRLCGEMISAREPNDVFESLREHEQSHPEYAEWVAISKEFSILDLPALLHDHDCVFVKCQCLCGCQNSICVADVPEENRQSAIMCEMCDLYQGRGHIEHRLVGD